jgi:hypothetical protein
MTSPRRQSDSSKARREARVPMRLPVTVWGMDLDGKLFRIQAHTMNITPAGARLEGIWKALYRGMNVGIDCGGRRARFRVTWIGRLGTGTGGEIGVQCVEPGRYIWGVPLKRYIGMDAA